MLLGGNSLPPQHQKVGTEYEADRASPKPSWSLQPGVSYTAANRTRL